MAKDASRAIMGSLVAGLLGAQAQETPPVAAADAQVERLRRMALAEIVSTPSKRDAPLFATPAGVSVITGEELRRLGVRSLADALRYVPGTQVASLDANKWAVSVRGFSDRFANKLLVLMDGRTVYSPIYGGTDWAVTDTLLEDVDRIEVVRGPGGTLWGANAVNGVINVITRPAGATAGAYLTGGGGNVDAFGAGRYGFATGTAGNLRGHVKYDDFQAFPLPDGSDNTDAWSRLQGGFRGDWEWEANRLMFQGAGFHLDRDQQVVRSIYLPPWSEQFTSTLEQDGGHLLGRWNHAFATAGELQVQTFWDRLEDTAPQSRFTTDIGDVELQHLVPLADWNSLTYGAGARLYSTDTAAMHESNATFHPPDRTYWLFNVFAQDEARLLDERLRLTAGVKFEHHEFTGWETQPGFRVAWVEPDERWMAWGAVSRAVREPSVAENDVTITLLPQPSPIPGLVAFPRSTGNRDLDAESLVAYEVGTRARVTPVVSLEVSGFLFDYHDLVQPRLTGDPFLEASLGVPYLVAPISAANLVDGKSYGVEVAAEWEVLDPWRLRAGYSWLKPDFSGDVFVGGGKDPAQQVFLRSTLELGPDVDLDVSARWVDQLPELDVPAYFGLDVRLAWRPRPWVEVAVVGRNLLDDQHAEFGAQASVTTAPSEVPRSVYGQVTFRF